MMYPWTHQGSPDVEHAGYDETYNILALDKTHEDHDALRFPEVRAARAALLAMGNLPCPEGCEWHNGMDLLDWLGTFFGFQEHNVKNQREHIVMLLADEQMRLQPPPDPIDRLDGKVVRKLIKKLLKNYVSWSSFLGRKNNLRLSKKEMKMNEQRELLYPCLYLLIWGEAANLRFMPECLCFIFHNMAAEMNRILERYIDKLSARPAMPAYIGNNSFLEKVVCPLYEVVKAEAEASQEGKAPHSAWRNYDDINEYFWSNRCFNELAWPLNRSCRFMVKPRKGRRKFVRRRVGKTFVERRSFWNIFRSFDHMWTGYILLLQAMIIIAFNSDSNPWSQLAQRQVQAMVLSSFITWAGLRLLESVLDVVMRYPLISREKLVVGLRMILKLAASLAWTLVFVVLYNLMWQERHSVGQWTGTANTAFGNFVKAAMVFIIPEILALVLFILPWISNFVERSEWKGFHIITWWFQSHWFVGRGLREGIWDNIKYTLFWLLILLVKFSFSYFLQIKPFVRPTREVLALTDIQYSWHEFWGKGNRVAIVMLWTPVLLIYFMDTQIWYAIFSSVVGGLVGLFANLGELRNMQQIKLRFPFFASAVSFNLIPEDLTSQHWGNSWSLALKNFHHRVKLRYGFGKNYRGEVNSLEARRFSLLWNSIISTLREEDLLCDRERELLEFPTPAWNVSVSQWPIAILSNELRLALEAAVKYEGNDDKQLWKKVCRNEYRKCAIIECFESVSYILSQILKEGSMEHGVIQGLLAGIRHSCQQGSFTQNYMVKELRQVYACILDFVICLTNKPQSDDLLDVIHSLQNLYEVVVRYLHSEKQPLNLVQEYASHHRQLLFADVHTVVLPDSNSDMAFFHQVKRLQTLLSNRNPMLGIPRNLEARRRLAFFSNSLFMKMPRAPSVEKMLAFSVLTPYYNEDVIYSKEKLEKKNEDGVSILYYLQKIFPDEWENFLERMRREYKDGSLSERNLWEIDALKLRLWASYRGQTLARTVRGMMYYHKALKLLAYLDGASEQEMQMGKELQATSSCHWSRNGGNDDGNIEEISKALQRNATASMKFTYVITCQIYGAQKARKEAQAEDILFLMKTYDALRIAYVDEIVSGSKYYSVLVKYDRFLEREVEIYRVQLPGPLKLGEEKPENQNHALIFTRGDALQTIDTNQDNYFEEALKVRNLMQEFTQKYGLRRPQILGVREHVFTGSVSALGRIMSAQETSFVTLGQRVLANPLRIRMHYGHSDVLDRLWFMTRGGLCKASRVINISQDIYAGFNCTLRGGNVTHHEYIQAGKGRDVGLNQIALFEATIACGYGEQVLSRDVYRLGHRLDFFRMLSFYYSSVGFFVSNLMVVLTVYVFLWGRVYLTLSGIEKAIQGSGALSNRAVTASLNQQFVIQLGLFTALPMIVENSIEHGFATALWEFLTMVLQLSSVFFAFSLGTWAHVFGRTILHGGAKYRGTGRGFVVVRETFVHNYRLFARSHFVKGVELILLLIIYQAFGAAGTTNTASYILITSSSWFLALSWIMAPFLFNPSGYDWLKAVEDFGNFMDWILFKKGISTKSDECWEVWWSEEQDRFLTTGIWGKVFEVVLSLRFFFLQYGIVYQLQITGNSKSLLVYLLSWVYVFAVLVIYIAVRWASLKYAVNHHIYFRLVQALLALCVLVLVSLLKIFTPFELTDAVLSLLVFMPTGWGLLSVVVVFKSFLERTFVWDLVISVARLYELVIGAIVFAPVAVLSWLPGFQGMQTRILFNQAFSRGLQMSKILVWKK